MERKSVGQLNSKGYQVISIKNPPAQVGDRQALVKLGLVIFSLDQSQG